MICCGQCSDLLGAPAISFRLCVSVFCSGGTTGFVGSTTFLLVSDPLFLTRAEAVLLVYCRVVPFGSLVSCSFVCCLRDSNSFSSCGSAAFGDVYRRMCPVGFLLCAFVEDVIPPLLVFCTGRRCRFCRHRSLSI